MGAGANQHADLSGLLILLPDSVRREARVVREPWHHRELLQLLWWGSFWAVAGRSSARLVRESRRSWGFAFVFPSRCLAKIVPALACSDLWPCGAHLQTPGSHTESLYS